VFARASLRLFVLLCASVACCPAVRAAELKDLLRYVPADANALLIVNAKKVFESEYGRNQAWKQDYAKNYAASPLLMPPDAQMFVMGARIDYEAFAPQWEVAVADLAPAPTIEVIAEKSRGTVDEIAGVQTVETLRDMFIVQFGGGVFGARKPANRQAVSQWLRDAQARQAPMLSTYLEEQAVFPEQVGTEMILAFDLADLIRADDVKRAMQASPVAAKASVSPDQVADVLASIRGITLGVRVTNRIYGKLKIDFTKETAPLAEIAQPLLVELASEAGAMIEEFTQWTAKTEGTRLTWEGELTRPGLRKLLSFLELDATPMRAADKPQQAPAGQAAAEEANKPYITKQYFDTVESHLEDLSHEKGAVSYGQIGLWFNKYAKRIERMPTLYVDDDVVNYGMWVSQQLRDAMAAIQGVGIRSGAREAQVIPTVTGTTVAGGYGPYNQYGTYGYGWRPYGGGYAAMQWEVEDVSAQKRAIRAEERATGSAQARDIMANIRAETQKVRRQMTERYKIEF
jgi:hypothetical protein